MYGHNVAHAYTQTSVTTADPLKLVLLCYEGAITNLAKAKEAYAGKAYEEKGKALAKAIAFINELNGSLDFKKGGAVAKNLCALYTYMNQRLLEGDLTNQGQNFDEVIGMLKELEAAWREIAARTRGNVVSFRPEMAQTAAAAQVAVAKGWSV